MTTLTEQMLEDIKNNDRWEKLYELFINSGKNFYEAWVAVNEIWEKESKNIEEIYKLEYEKLLETDFEVRIDSLDQSKESIQQGNAIDLYNKYWAFKLYQHHPITYYKNECVIIQCSVCLYSKHRIGREQIECLVCFKRVCVGPCQEKHKNVCKKLEPVVINLGEKKRLF